MNDSVIAQPIPLSLGRANELYVAQPTGSIAAFGAPTGTLSRATFNSATVTLDTLAQVVAALITDLQTLEALQVVAAPVNTVAPSISGTATVGQTLTANTGTWTGNISGYTYQWKRGGSNIGGATGSTYTLVTADYSTVITVTVTAAGNGGSTSATSAGTSAVAGIAPVNTVAPTITGTARVGETLTLNLGTWTGTPTPTLAGELRYVSDETVIASLSANGTYTVLAADVGETLYLRVVGTNAVSSTTASSSATSAVSGVVIYDTFTDTNSVSLDAHTPDIGGVSWVEALGNFDIQSNRANVVSTGVTPVAAFAVVEAGISDGVASAIVRPTATYPAGVIVRYVNNGNFWCGLIAGTSLYLCRFVSGSVTVVASATITNGAGIDAVLEIVLNGTSITLTYDGSVSLSATSSTHQSATKFGLYSEQAGDRFDNFQVSR